METTLRSKWNNNTQDTFHSNLQNGNPVIQDNSNNMPKSSLSEWKWAVFCLLGVAAVILWLVNMPEERVSSSPLRWTISLLLPVFISLYGMKKKSLDFSGGMVAILVGFILTAASACFCVSLLTFFITSSRLTKWKGKEKRKFEEDYKEGGQRNWVQVVCNGGVASMAALLYLHSVGMGEQPIKLWPRGVDLPTVYAISSLAALSCSCGDTWASEVGTILGGTPRLVTTWKPVPKGTNGGVTMVGTVCSIAGGLLVGVAYFLSLLLFLDFSHLGISWTSQLPVIVIGTAAGLSGSLVDSLLGATVQYSGYSTQLGKVVYSPVPGAQHISGLNILDNHAVNFVSSLITAILIPIGCLCVLR